MATLDIHNQNGQVVGQQEIASDLAQAPVHTGAVHQAVVAQLANRRSGTADTKTRAEVRGSGRKLYRQKGTGRARVGTNRSPIRVGGGTAFGPKPRSFRQHTPKKVKRLAFRSAIADKIHSQRLLLVEALQMQQPKTKDAVAFLSGLPIDGKKILVVLEQQDSNVFYSFRNLPFINVMTSDQISTYQVLWHDTLIVTQGAMAGIEKRCSDAEPTKPDEEAAAV